MLLLTRGLTGDGLSIHEFSSRLWVHDHILYRYGTVVRKATLSICAGTRPSSLTRTGSCTLFFTVMVSSFTCRGHDIIQDPFPVLRIHGRMPDRRCIDEMSLRWVLNTRPMVINAARQYAILQLMALLVNLMPVLKKQIRTVFSLRSSAS